MTTSRRLLIGAFVTLAGLLAVPGIGWAANAANAGAESALRLQVVGTAGMKEGTCFLVHREQRDHDVVFYFLTSSLLLDPEAVGESRSTSLRVRVVVDASSALETGGANLLFPGGIASGLGIAIVRTVSAERALSPAAIAMQPPEAGDPFVIWRAQADGSKSIVREHVLFRSTSLVIGDRTALDRNTLLGAPAAGDGGVFGVVSNLEPGGAPIVALLSAARGFLAAGIPGWVPGAPAGAAPVRLD